MTVVRINEQNFNADFAKSIDEQKFIDTLAPAPFWNEKPDKEALLRKAWRLMNGVLEEPEKQEGGKVSRKRAEKKEGAE